MRGLWRTIALIAEDANSFNSQLAPIARQVQNLNLTNGKPLSTPPAPPISFNLQLQPTPAILQNIDAYLRSLDPTLMLTTYELAEVNRLVCDTRNENPPHENLKAYWRGLGAVGPQNRNVPGFMEAIGGLAIDGWTRSQFAAGNVDLTRMFDFAGAQPGAHQALRSAVVGGSRSDSAAQRYFLLSWGHPNCLPTIAISPDWVHINA